MDVSQPALENALAGLRLGRVEYLPQVGSTNDRAAALAAEGAPDFSLVMADEQTAGRGRAGRQWFTPPGSALALSVLIRPTIAEATGDLSRFSALGALAVCQALELSFGLSPEIKWPNDVLLSGRKVCGVLAEAAWNGTALEALVLGVGVNVCPGAVPPPDFLRFPAASLEEVIGKPVNRLGLLRAVVESLLAWRAVLPSEEFIAAWDQRLAWRGQRVQLIQAGTPPITGRLLGLNASGHLHLQTISGASQYFQAGELSLRPVDNG